MHAVIRIVSFLVLAVALSLGATWQHIVLGAVLVLFGYGAARNRGLRHLSRMLLRLRWLWLSLCVVYFWFTPGTDLFPALGRWSPSVAGVQEGLVRVGILIIMAAGANLLLQATSREHLLAAVHWLAAPLDLLGLSRDRFALRLVLVLETVPRIQPLNQVRQPDPSAHRNRIARIAGSAATLFRSTLEQARSAPLHEITIPDMGAPPWYQWSIPIALGVAFWLAGYL